MRDGVITEADTCREFVTPGWSRRAGVRHPMPSASNAPSPDGRIIVVGGTVRRAKQKRADYLL